MKILGIFVISVLFIFFNSCCDVACNMKDVGVDRLFRVINYLLLVAFMFVVR